RMLRGHYSFADLIVVPRTSESYLQLYYYLLEVRKWEPERRFPDLYLFDLLQAPNWTVGSYDRGRLDDLRHRLHRVAGRAMTDEVNGLRRRDPPLISGTDMLRIAGAAGFMAIADHSAALRVILAGADALSPIAGKRIMVKGSPRSEEHT